MIDLGMAAKPRPAAILSVQFADDEKAVVTYVARTTQARGGRFEVEHRAPLFLPGVFDAQEYRDSADSEVDAPAWTVAGYGIGRS